MIAVGRKPCLIRTGNALALLLTELAILTRGDRICSWPAVFGQLPAVHCGDDLRFYGLVNGKQESRLYRSTRRHNLVECVIQG